jgi:hypothetical protein
LGIPRGTPIYSPTADREGGLIKMAEGGAPPKMTELFVEDMGSTFDISTTTSTMRAY